MWLCDYDDKKILKIRRELTQKLRTLAKDPLTDDTTTFNIMKKISWSVRLSECRFQKVYFYTADSDMT